MAWLVVYRERAASWTEFRNVSWGVHFVGYSGPRDAQHLLLVGINTNFLSLYGTLISYRQMIIVMAPRAGRKLHSTVLQHALQCVSPSQLGQICFHSYFCRAPLSFLSQTDMGIIMNRFSQNMPLIDFQVTLTSMSAAEGKKYYSEISNTFLTGVPSQHLAQRSLDCL